MATWDPIKNLDLLVKTFINIKNQGLLPQYKLVLIGGKGWKYKNLVDRIACNERDPIVSRGYVTNEDLPPLYTGAEIFIFPSIYEGFGMPVLEARACGTRVVTTDIPELREAGGSDAIYIKPTQESIQQGILDALKQPPPQRSSLDLPTWEESSLALGAALCGERQ